MFDIGASEIFLTALVALLVLGPERLPKAARFAGLWIRRARAQWASVKAELEREMEAERLRADLGAAQPLNELKTAVQEVHEAVMGAQQATTEAMRKPPEAP